jgi:hypothetical protein
LRLTSFLIFRQEPFVDLGNQYNLFYIKDFVTSGKRLQVPAATPLPLARLISDCWAEDPMSRPSALEIKTILNEVRRVLLEPVNAKEE